MAEGLRAAERARDREENAVPPHCDSMDGPVVVVARRALEEEDVDLVLP
jgi:hypothetical protein